MSSLSNKKSEEDYCFGEFVFPSDSIIDVKYVDGKKEGRCKIVSKNNVLVAELNFHEDLLNGNSIFYNANGELIKYYVFDNGIKNKYYTIEMDRMKPYETNQEFLDRLYEEDLERKHYEEQERRYREQLELRQYQERLLSRQDWEYIGNDSNNTVETQ